MSNSSVYDNAYIGGDTSFRRTWDREEYTAKAANREARERAEGKARYEAKQAGKKYIAVKHDEGMPDDSKMIEARRERINFDENLNKTMLVPVGATGGKRGKGAGYYCEACDLNYKNSLEWVEHLNSKQHMANTGQSGIVEKATLEQVRERLRWLKAIKDQQEKAEEFDLKKRLEERQRVEDQERLEKKEKKKIKREEELKRKKDLSSVTIKNIDGDVEMDNDAAAMAKMMGFGGFGSTKAKA